MFEIIGVFAGEAGLLGACSDYSDTLLGSEIMSYVFYAPGFQVPVALACACLIAATALPRGPLSHGWRAIVAASVVWLVLMLWFWEPGSTLKGVGVFGLALGLVLAFYVWALIGLRRAVVATRARLAVAVIVAFVASFATPIVVITVSCAFGDCF